MTPNEYTLMISHARVNGAIMGLIWVASFFCFAFARINPMLSIAFDISIICIPFIAVTVPVAVSVDLNPSVGFQE